MIVSFGVLLAMIPSDAELVGSIVASDERSFHTLFDRYHPDLYRYLRRLGVEDEIALDILQDAFLAVWERRQSLDSSKSIRAYLYRACHNKALNHFRDSKRHPDDLTDVETLPAQDHADPTEFANLQEALGLAVSHLPPRQRAVFELCFIAGNTYQEASDVLDISKKTVENHMARAFKSVRLALKDYSI